MLLVLAGTKDGRDLAGILAAEGFRVLASAATAYGGELLQEVPGIAVHVGRLDAEGLNRLVEAYDIKGIVDATHPFAVEISRLAREAAASRRIPCLCWERPPASLCKENSQLLHRAADWEGAVRCLAALRAKRLFLAVGVRPLAFFVNHPALRGRHFLVRVLPLPEAVAACRRLGLRPEQICALQGPVTQELNRALLEHFRAEALVTKESGPAGGTGEKVAAALSLGIPVVLVDRPRVESAAPKASTVEEVLRWAAEVEGRRDYDKL